MGTHKSNISCLAEFIPRNMREIIMREFPHAYAAGQQHYFSSFTSLKICYHTFVWYVKKKVIYRREKLAEEQIVESNWYILYGVRTTMNHEP